MGKRDGISAWRLVLGRLVGYHSGWEECVLEYDKHLEMVRDDDRTCRLCILHQAIVYNGECPTQIWKLSKQQMTFRDLPSGLCIYYCWSVSTQAGSGRRSA